MAIAPQPIYMRTEETTAIPSGATASSDHPVLVLPPPRVCSSGCSELRDTLFDEGRWAVGCVV